MSFENPSNKPPQEAPEKKPEEKKEEGKEWSFSKQGLLNRNFDKDVEKPSETLFDKGGILNQPKFQEMAREQKEQHDKETVVVDEIKKGIIDAEEIALAERDLTQKIFVGNLPPEEWASATQETLSAHPSIKSYKPFFDEYIEEARERNKAVNAIWGEAEKKVKESDLAGDSVEAELFLKFFSRKPLDKDKLSVIKGKQSFGMEASKRDIYSISGGRRGIGGFMRTISRSTMTGNYLTHTEIPVAVYENISKGAAKATLMHHEVQHGLNYSERNARQNSLRTLESQFRELPASIKILYTERRGNESGLEKEVKDEILAYIKGVFGSYSYDYRNPLTLTGKIFKILDQKFIKNPGRFEKRIYSLLTRSKIYNFKGRYILDEQETEKYQKDVKRALTASMELLNFYKQIYSGKATDITISILQKFPMHNWPGIVRLIKRRHKIA